MIGTEKQIDFAKTILAGAKAWHLGKGRSAAQIDAIAFVEAIEASDYATAERLSETAAGWIGAALVPGETPEISAEAVIEALKKSYYCAKDNGLV